MPIPKARINAIPNPMRYSEIAANNIARADADGTRPPVIPCAVSVVHVILRH
jgi:hypothetical protein